MRSAKKEYVLPQMENIIYLEQSAPYRRNKYFRGSGIIDEE
jgi:hypothetical protein